MRTKTENLDIPLDFSANMDSTEPPEETASGLKSGGAAVAAWMIRNVYMEKEKK